MKWYPGDWLLEKPVREISPEARGVYFDLLCVAWRDGSITTDRKWLAKDLHVSTRKFERIWEEIEQFWVHAAEGELVNPRQEQERKAAMEIYEQRVKAGQKGGRPKANGKQP